MHLQLSLLLSAGPLFVFSLSSYAQTLQLSSQTIASGKYYLQNALTGESLTYTKDDLGHNLHLSDEASGIYLKPMGAYTVLSPITSRNKCLSAQWDVEEKATTAVALFACRATDFKRKRRLGRDSFPETDREGARQSIFESRTDFERRIYEDEVMQDRKTLAAMQTYEETSLASSDLAKQYFYLLAGSQKNAFRLVAVDHLEPGEKPRALQGRARVQQGAATMALAELDMLDMSQEWLVTTLPGTLKR